MSFNLGTVQENPAAMIGLNMGDYIKDLINILVNGNKQNLYAYEAGATAVNKENEATIKMGKQQAAQTFISAGAEMAQGFVKGFASAVGGVASTSTEAKIATKKGQIDKLNAFDSGLKNVAEGKTATGGVRDIKG